MSCVAPGGSGCILALVSDARKSTLKSLQVLARAREGKIVLFLGPVAPDHFGRPVADKNMKRSKMENSESARELGKLASTLDICPACGQPGLGVAHVWFHCTGREVTNARSRFLRDVPRTLGKLFGMLLKAMIPAVTDRENAAEMDSWNRQQQWAGTQDRKMQTLVRTLVFGDCGPDGTDPPLYTPPLSQDVMFCLYRLLMVVPWSTEALRNTPPQIEKDLATLFGRAFEETNTHYHRVRGVANMRCEWASNAVFVLLISWRTDASLPGCTI